jgi:hypothetical protein
MVLSQLFEATTQHKPENFWTVTAIQNELAKHLRSSDIPNMTILGNSIKRLRWQKYKKGGVRGFYLKLKSSV